MFSSVSCFLYEELSLSKVYCTVIYMVSAGHYTTEAAYGLCVTEYNSLCLLLSCLIRFLGEERREEKYLSMENHFTTGWESVYSSKTAV